MMDKKALIINLALLGFLGITGFSILVLTLYTEITWGYALMLSGAGSILLYYIIWKRLNKPQSPS